MEIYLKLSVALTTYNHEEYISDSLDSILNQQVDFNYEIVIGEDKSTDNTFAIIKSYAARYPEKIRILERNSNIGYTKNLNDTLRQCKGEYIAIFDGDDIMLPNKLQKQVEFLNLHPEFVMTGHDVRAFDSKTNKTIRYISPGRKKSFYTLEDLIKHGSFFANCSKIFRKAALPESDIDENIKFIADWYITMQIVKEGKIGYMWEVLSNYRIHPLSIMQTLKGKQDYEDKMVILNKLNHIYNYRYNGLFNRQLAYAYLVYGLDELNNKKIKSARHKFLQSIKYQFYYSPIQFYYLFACYCPVFLRTILMKIKNKLS